MDAMIGLLTLSVTVCFGAIELRSANKIRRAQFIQNIFSSISNERFKEVFDRVEREVDFEGVDDDAVVDLLVCFDEIFYQFDNGLITKKELIYLEGEIKILCCNNEIIKYIKEKNSIYKAHTKYPPCSGILCLYDVLK